jgi:hypothetical protein
MVCRYLNPNLANGSGKFHDQNAMNISPRPWPDRTSKGGITAALRYWLKSAGMAEQDYPGGQRILIFTDFSSSVSAIRDRGDRYRRAVWQNRVSGEIWGEQVCFPNHEAPAMRADGGVVIQPGQAQVRPATIRTGVTVKRHGHFAPGHRGRVLGFDGSSAVVASFG